MGPRIHVDADEIRRLYVDERYTTEAIARRLATSSGTILRRLVASGIPRRRRGPATRRGPAPTSWSPEVAYVVGLIVTDGNLSGDGRHLTVTSTDTELLDSVRRCLGLTAAIRPCTVGGRCYRVQWGDRSFYDWLLTVGLMPAKSLRLAAIAVPDPVLRDFLRGCIDGDGSIVVYRDRSNAHKNPKYVYDRLWVSLVSASPCFLEWL